jgi:hypothetical protein
VNYSRTFKWAIAVLILLTIGWKIAIPSDDASDLDGDLIAFFKRNNFSVTLADRIVDPDIGATDVPIIQANMDSCTVLVAALIFDGSNRQLIERRLASADRRFVVFRGKIYTEQPIFLTVTNYLWSRFLTELRLGRRQSPALAIGSDASCNADLLPWTDLHW